LHELLKRLQDRHDGCAKPFAKHAATDAQAAADVRTDTSNVLHVMMQVNQSNTHAKVTTLVK
jgi:hypothetical protein